MCLFRNFACKQEVDVLSTSVLRLKCLLVHILISSDRREQFKNIQQKKRTLRSTWLNGAFLSLSATFAISKKAKNQFVPNDYDDIQNYAL